MNPCLSGNQCSENQNCIVGQADDNLPNVLQYDSYYCECLNGLDLINDECMTVNECTMNTHNCPAGTIC